MAGRSRAQQKLDEGNVIAGLEKNQATLANLIVQGKQVTVAQAIAALQDRIDGITAAQAARVALTDAVRDQDARIAKSDPFIASLLASLRGMFDGSPSALADFGFAPRKAPELTAEQKRAAVDKRNATRKARHTMGSRQKAAIKGGAT